MQRGTLGAVPCAAGARGLVGGLGVQNSRAGSATQEQATAKLKLQTSQSKTDQPQQAAICSGEVADTVVS